MVLAEQVTTVSKSVLRNYAGHISDDELMKRIDLAVSVQLGLWKDDGGSMMADLVTGIKATAYSFTTEEKGAIE